MKKGIIFGIAGCASLAAIIYAITRGSKSDTKPGFSKPMGTEEDGIEFPEGIFDDDFEDEDEDVTEITCEEVGRVFVVDPECLYGVEQSLGMTVGVMMLSFLSQKSQLLEG